MLPTPYPRASHFVPAALLAALASLLAGSVVSAALPAASSYDVEADYDVAVFLDWDTGRVSVKTSIEVLNDSGAPVDRLELNTVAAPLGSLRGLVSKVNGAAVPARVRGQTISVPFGTPLAAGARATLWIAFRARLPVTASGRGFLWTRANGVAQLYRFIPWVSRRIPFGDEPHGEPFLTPNSPTARVTLDSDRPMVWATSGRRVGKVGRKVTFLAHDVRDFSVTASPAYKTTRGRSKDDATAIFAHTLRLDGRRLVQLARTELARYKAKTGVAYPHATYRIAETRAGLPMESPGLIWIPGHRATVELPFLVSHETAHQWFYGIVGNDQATNAFADEALADYYSRKAHLSLRPSRCPIDRLDRNIRDYSSRCYYEVIYNQGALFLESLRRDFGTAAFGRAIRAYVHDNQNGLGSNGRLLEAFRAEMGNGVLPRYRKRFPSLY